ncbi:unnamed protein product [Linum tenue]|uniref:Uncharacterized protein n=1 Tax=Linum tenue TaxID=586396 RepID=A0AAV0K3G5_9ROSI|nr:unnamed protein product [Linum tenue]
MSHLRQIILRNLTPSFALTVRRYFCRFPARLISATRRCSPYLPAKQSHLTLLPPSGFSTTSSPVLCRTQTTAPHSPQIQSSNPYSHFVKTTDEIQISPPPGSVPATSLPLTFFDITFLGVKPIQRVFFYNIPNCNVPHFRQTILPNLTSSLSLALRYFYPFAARLVSPSRPGKPYIRYSDGDSVSLTVAETALDFDQVSTDLPNDAALLHTLLPKLPPAESKPDDDGAIVAPLLAVKITLFPDSGVCIGFEFLHVAADGLAFSNFVKSWASICRSGGEDSSWVENSPPCLDRSLIHDPRNLKDIFTEQVWNFAEAWQDDSILCKHSGKVRATFAIDREDISRLKATVNRDNFGDGKQLPPASAFAVTSALIWTNLMKSLDLVEEKAGEDGGGGEKIDSNVIVADFRGRLDPPLPATYFGNCVGVKIVSVKRRQLLGDDGFVVAAKAITAGVQGLGEEALEDAEKWITGFGEAFKFGKVVTVAGSPRMRVYESDFGWGRPRKVEPVQIDTSDTVYISDARDEERGGLEFGLVLRKDEMDTFVTLFEKLLNQLRQVD